MYLVEVQTVAQLDVIAAKCRRRRILRDTASLFANAAKHGPSRTHRFAIHHTEVAAIRPILASLNLPEPSPYLGMGHPFALAHNDPPA
jgi:hypothetical protein